MTGLCQYLDDRDAALKSVYCKRDNLWKLRQDCQQCDGKPVPEAKKKTAPLPVTRPPCQMLGKELDGYAACSEGCGKGVKLKLYACQIFSAATLYKHGVGVAACCRDCPHYHEAHQ